MDFFADDVNKLSATAPTDAWPVRPQPTRGGDLMIETQEHEETKRIAKKKRAASMEVWREVRGIRYL